MALSDPDFLDNLLCFVARDVRFMREHGHTLDSTDFQKSREGDNQRERAIVADVAMQHWKALREPIGGLLVSKLSRHARLGRFNSERGKALVAYGRSIMARPLTNYQGIAKHLIDWKTEIVMGDALEEFMTLHEQGTLSPSNFMKLATEAVKMRSRFGARNEDFAEETEARLDRRESGTLQRYYLSLIDPLDDAVRLIARGMLLLILAPYKRGKSMFLIWLAVAYCMQRLNVIYITLEDTKDDVDARFDSVISNIPLRELRDNRATVSERVRRFFKIHKGRFKVIDGTHLQVTLEDLEQIWLTEKENGFVADAVIVDYAEELKASRQNKDRRHELAEIMVGLRRFASRENLLLVTAAQTQRYTADLKVLDGDTVAEDISMIRKATCTLGLGKGEFEESDSIYIHVAAHKHDKGGFGCNIVPDKTRAVIYDAEATRKEAKKWRIKMAMDQQARGAAKKPAKKKPNYRMKP